MRLSKATLTGHRSGCAVMGWPRATSARLARQPLALYGIGAMNVMQPPSRGGQGRHGHQQQPKGLPERKAVGAVVGFGPQQVRKTQGSHQNSRVSLFDQFSDTIPLLYQIIKKNLQN